MPLHTCLHSEFQVIQGYTVIPSVSEKKKNPQSRQAVNLSSCPEEESRGGKGESHAVAR